MMRNQCCLSADHGFALVKPVVVQRNASIRQNGVPEPTRNCRGDRRSPRTVDRAARLSMIERIGARRNGEQSWREVPNRSRQPHAARARRANTIPKRTKRDILSVATKEFAKHGYNGARIDAIAARTSTTKRMIYYYFGGKEPLYIAVLEQEYGRIRTYEAGLHLERLEPEPAHPAADRIHVRLRPRPSRTSCAWSPSRTSITRDTSPSRRRFARVNATIVDTIDAILQRGRREGIFHAQRARGRRAHADERVVLLSRVESSYVRHDLPARLPFPERPADAQENGRGLHRSACKARLAIGAAATRLGLFAGPFANSEICSSRLAATRRNEPSLA